MKREEFILTDKVKKALESGEPMEGMGGSDGFWYNITDGGYVKVEDLIGDKVQIWLVKNALETIRELQKLYEEISFEF